jgi:nucleotide-binding universal stress UspA family protein
MAEAAIRHILFPFDLSEPSVRAFAHARYLAEAFAARVTLYHALEVPRDRYGLWAAGRETEVWDAAEKTARERLAALGAGLRTPHEIVIERGIPAASVLVDIALVARIQATRPDLAVMATSARTAVSHLLGGVTQRVLESAAAPLLCVRSAGDAGRIPYRRILVPTDLSPASRRALPWAALLAGKLSAEVVGLHVVPDDHPSPPTPAEVARFLAAEPGLEGARVRVETGSAWRRIAEVSADEAADLVVVSTRGHDSMSDAVLGSTAERAVRYAACPVLVV